ncbi:MBL fold metallo-hydrolase [Pseudoroseicyclus tamaricis]|uniref:MBL fold metallo-hydrolase n=1 Tax=Pseudoroseicyclus tamaricis TaxID=2705421 RepID=A0A6B2JKI2_9RHOB|nr:MBL fold metallo-hydrolase [Pseudoroseicyclus tamaricis]NDV02001.1 MBL fold metallo-hydrolase [Pseudoroseicyclus tamaricis]
MARLTARILGCGSSGGVPRLGGHWGDCDPANPKNHRTRCSLLLTRHGEGGVTRVLIDTSPDMRSQLLAADVGRLDAVVYTHPHADHVHGIDDLRQVVFNTRRRMQVWADGQTSDMLLTRFAYVFATPEGSSYPPICDLNLIEGPFEVSGAGGPLTFEPLRVQHGDIPALGFRIGDLAYLPDVNAIPEETWRRLAGLDCLILDALRRDPHPSHAHLDQALEWIGRAKPERAVLTNLHVDLDYDTLAAELPAGVSPAHDGRELELDLAR